jgi:hypothetical protein
MTLLVTTVYLAKETEAVERWSRSARTHVTGVRSVAISRYTQSMYSVDEVNKSAAATNIRTLSFRITFPLPAPPPVLQTPNLTLTLTLTLISCARCRTSA